MTEYPGGVPRHDILERHGTSEDDADLVLTPDGAGGLEWQSVGGGGVGHDRLHDVESALDHETKELDTSLVLHPDGSGCVAWGAGGAGDMLKATYDTDDNGVVDDSEQLGGVDAADYLTEAEHTAIGDSAPHHARYTDGEARAAINADADHSSTAPHSHSDLADVGSDDHHARYTDAESEAVADTQIATHASDADAHHNRQHDIGNAADHNGILGVPIRMDIHGIPMDAGFEMDNGRLMGYNV